MGLGVPHAAVDGRKVHRVRERRDRVRGSTVVVVVVVPLSLLLQQPHFFESSDDFGADRRRRPKEQVPHRPKGRGVVQIGGFPVGFVCVVPLPLQHFFQHGFVQVPQQSVAQNFGVAVLVFSFEFSVGVIVFTRQRPRTGFGTGPHHVFFESNVPKILLAGIPIQVVVEEFEYFVANGSDVDKAKVDTGAAFKAVTVRNPPVQHQSIVVTCIGSSITISIAIASASSGAVVANRRNQEIL
mmetsp:Transcript_23364/g.47719  ORF Transcript_23364/g.47719 Transcript_23364/m.47719 type:complete len:240 (-) Transcript_23364:572-1291(-)